MLRITLAGLHLLALAIGLMAVVLRGSLMREGLGPESLRRVFRMDTFWGVAALLWLVTGLWRLLAQTEKPMTYYFENHAFILKMVLFVAVVVLEIAPMMVLLRARLALRNGVAPGDAIAPAARRRVALIGHIQATLLLVMLFAAATMARGYGLPVAP